MKCHLVTKAQFQPTLKNLTRHYTYTYIYYSLFLFFFSTFVPLLTPSSDKTLPTRGSEVYCKKRTSRRVNESILASSSLASFPNRSSPPFEERFEGERERERTELHLRFLPPLPRPGRHREHVVDRWKISRRSVVDEAANRTISYFRRIRSPRPSLVHTLSYWYISFRFFLSSFLRARYRVRGGKRKEGREREREGRIGAVSRESQNGLDTVSFIPLKQDRLAPRMEDNCNAVANQPCIYTHIYTFEREKK